MGGRSAGMNGNTGAGRATDGNEDDEGPKPGLPPRQPVVTDLLSGGLDDDGEMGMGMSGWEALKPN